MHFQISTDYIPITEEEYFSRLEHYTSKRGWYILAYFLRSTVPFAYAAKFFYYLFPNPGLTNSMFAANIRDDLVAAEFRFNYPDCNNNISDICIELVKLRDVCSIAINSAMCAGFCSGILCDIIGRRTLSLLYSTFWIIASYTTPFIGDSIYSTVLFFEMFFGISVYFISYVNLSELSSDEFSLITIYTDVGFIFGFIYFKHKRITFESKMYLDMLYSSVLFFVLFAVWYIPESPKWLYAKGSKNKALDILEEFSGTEYRAHRVHPKQIPKLLTKKQIKTVWKLFWKSKWTVFILLILTLSTNLMFSCGFWTMMTIPDKTFGTQYTAMLCYTLGFVIFYPTLQLFGKRYSLVVMLGVMIFLILLTITDLTKETVHYMMMMSIVTGVTGNYICILRTVELMPALIRGTGIGLCTTIMGFSHHISLRMLDWQKDINRTVLLCLLSSCIGGVVIMHFKEKNLHTTSNSY